MYPSLVPHFGSIDSVLVSGDGDRRRFRVLRSVNCGRLRSTGQVGTVVSLVPRYTPGPPDRFHSVPAALHVKLPTNVALISRHGSAMIHTGHPWPRATSVAALPMENADCGTRNLFFMSIELPARSTLRTTRRRDATPILILNTEHFTFSTFWRSPASLSFAAPYATARCSYLASIASGFHALRDRRNPAAGPVIAATSMHAAGCAFRSSIFQRKAVRSFKRTVGT
jgi:hypothetical protein